MQLSIVYTMKIRDWTLDMIIMLNQGCWENYIDKGYYTVMQRYGFYLRVMKTIFYK